MPPHGATDSDLQAHALYRDALSLLTRSGIPYLVGGAYALRHYTGVDRSTRDFDVFVAPADCPRVLECFARAGYETELTYPFWLGKCRRGDHYVDIIFSSGNGVATVDPEWFDRGVAAVVLGRQVCLIPPEEMIWSKAFVMERERFDGADVIHLIRSRGSTLDWDRLMRRFEPHPHVLLAHILLFEFVYPESADLVPPRVRRALLDATRDGHGPAASVCRGTLLSRSQYQIDLERGYHDARVQPHGDLRPEDLARWNDEGLTSSR